MQRRSCFWSALWLKSRMTPRYSTTSHCVIRSSATKRRCARTSSRPIAWDARHGGINILLGNEALAGGRLPDAVAHYEIARQSPAAASVANWNLAVVYNRMGRADKVREHLKTVSDASAQEFDAQRWLAL